MIVLIIYHTNGGQCKRHIVSINRDGSFSTEDAVAKVLCFRYE
jgi:hypothetical protein